LIVRSIRVPNGRLMLGSSRGAAILSSGTGGWDGAEEGDM